VSALLTPPTDGPSAPEGRRLVSVARRSRNCGRPACPGNPSRTRSRRWGLAPLCRSSGPAELCPPGPGRRMAGGAQGPRVEAAGPHGIPRVVCQISRGQFRHEQGTERTFAGPDPQGPGGGRPPVPGGPHPGRHRGPTGPVPPADRLRPGGRPPGVAPVLAGGLQRQEGRGAGQGRPAGAGILVGLGGEQEGAAGQHRGAGRRPPLPGRRRAVHRAAVQAPGAPRPHGGPPDGPGRRADPHRRGGHGPCRSLRTGRAIRPHPPPAAGAGRQRQWNRSCRTWGRGRRRRTTGRRCSW